MFWLAVPTVGKHTRAVGWHGMAASGHHGHVADPGQALVWPQGVRVPTALGANKWWIGLCEGPSGALLLFWSSLWSGKWAHRKTLWLAALISDWGILTAGQAFWLPFSASSLIWLYPTLCVQNKGSKRLWCTNKSPASRSGEIISRPSSFFFLFCHCHHCVGIKAGSVLQQASLNAQIILLVRALVQQYAQSVMKIDLMPSSNYIWSALRAVVLLIGVCRCLDLMSPSSVMETNCTNVVIIRILLYCRCLWPCTCVTKPPFALKQFGYFNLVQVNAVHDAPKSCVTQQLNCFCFFD